jgi:hypothetical protein
MAVKNIDKTLVTLLVWLSAHCRRWRLTDLKPGLLTNEQRCAVMGATLDYLERAVEQEHRINAAKKPEADHGKGTGRERSIGR